MCKQVLVPREYDMSDGLGLEHALTLQFVYL